MTRQRTLEGVPEASGTLFSHRYRIIAQRLRLKRRRRRERQWSCDRRRELWGWRRDALCRVLGTDVKLEFGRRRSHSDLLVGVVEFAAREGTDCVNLLIATIYISHASSSSLTTALIPALVIRNSTAPSTPIPLGPVHGANTTFTQRLHLFNIRSP